MAIRERCGNRRAMPSRHARSWEDGPAIRPTLLPHDFPHVSLGDGFRPGRHQRKAIAGSRVELALQHPLWRESAILGSLMLIKLGEIAQRSRSS